MPQEKYTFVHLSDIHFGQEVKGSVAVHEHAREMLLQDIAVMRGDVGDADGVLVTGDIAYGGLESQYNDAGLWLHRVTDSAGCQPKSVRIIPGNHDIDLSKIDGYCELAHTELRNVHQSRIDEKLELFLNGPDGGIPLLNKLAAYRQFARRFGCDFSSPQDHYWIKPYSLGSRYSLSFRGMNSVQVSDLTDSPSKLVLGRRQYIFVPEKNVAVIALLHHPLLWFRDRPTAATYLKKASVIMVGHEHVLDIQKVQTIDGFEQVEIFSGATNDPSLSMDYPFRYAWISFSLSGTPACRSLRLTVWPRVWSTAQTKFIPDLNRLNGRTHASFDIACPQFEEDESPRPDALPSNVIDCDSCDRTEADMSPPDDDAFEQLAYLFWTYLTWEQRYTLLVKIGAFPDSQGPPPGQVFERLALETARRTGKLEALWDLMVQYIPDEDQSPNPFASGDSNAKQVL